MKKGRRRSGFRGMGSSMMPLLGAAGYGAVRAQIASFISPVTNKIPLGGISDEVGLLIGLELTKRFVKNKTVRQIATVGQYIEAASIGQAISLGQVNLQPGTTTNSGTFSVLG